uniref:TORC_N domain-containing protein n=1 Tax=Elaeophora elaphi TaxID=1147741 RepID=A0A0R3RNB9_9BILA
MFDKDARSNEAIHKESDSSSASSLFMVTGNRRSNANFHSNLDLTSNEFLAFLERMQSQRLDDQRCEMPDIHVSFHVFFSFFIIQ